MTSQPPPIPPGPPGPPGPLGPPPEKLAARLQEAARVLAQSFIDKQEIVRLMLISAVAGEHMLLVGPPGTAKSALVRLFARLIDARYFEYLLTRFTEPNELFGPVDIRAFREGTYNRRTEGMLPEAEIVFLDEIFKSNSAILNSLLTVLAERRFANGARVLKVPLISMFGASNEVPNDENLAALFDRFLLRVLSDNLDSYHFHKLVETGLRTELGKMSGADAAVRPVFTAADLHGLHLEFSRRVSFGEEFFARYKGLVFQIRSEGISLSDRRVVKLLKLFAASAILDGRDQVNDGDFFILKHVWNNLDQTELLDQIVSPVVDRWYRDHPEQRRFVPGAAGLDDILAELQIIRELLTSGQPLSDIQLFSQLKNLNEIRAALAATDSEAARRMVREIDGLLENVFSSSKFG
jgi:MoxR-like ATPase